MNLHPSYAHDCDRCVFIASISSFGRHIDLYRSCSKIEGGYIARFSSEPSDYATVIEGRGPLTQTLEGQHLVRTDFTTCQTVEAFVNANRPS